MSWRPFVNLETSKRIPRKLRKRAARNGYDLHAWRQKWPPGPWHQEHDFLRFEAHGLRCMIHRHREFGSLCGYVAVERDHPCYGLGYDDVRVLALGGLTYADQSNSYTHWKKGPYEAPLWWFGFDCAHLGDLVPGLINGRWGELMKTVSPRMTYKPEAFVRWAVEELAARLAQRGRMQLVGVARPDPGTLLARRCSSSGCEMKPVNASDLLCPIHKLRQAAHELHRLLPEHFPAPPGENGADSGGSPSEHPSEEAD